MKPREWWISVNSDNCIQNNLIHPSCTIPENVHVIEKSAYDELIATFEQIAMMKPDDHKTGLAYQSNFLNISIAVKWAQEAVKRHVGGGNNGA